MSRKQIKLVDFGEPPRFKINRSKPKRIIKTADYKEPVKEKPVPPKGKRPKIKMVNFEEKKPKFKVVAKAKPKIMSKKEIDIVEPAPKKDKFTLYLEKNNPNFYESIKKEFFNNKTRMTKAKALGIFKKKLVDEYKRLINKN